MGRQYKVGLDYFELDCHMEEKVRLIQAEFGLKGFAILVKLYQKIYGEFGYYCEWNDDSLLLFMSENGLGDGSEKNLINEVVQACIRRNIFSAEIYKKYGVLTSVGVQKRYLIAVSKRESVELKKEYLLISDGINAKNVVINAISDGRNAISDGRNTQRRVEKSKEEKSKEENKDILAPSELEGVEEQKPKTSSPKKKDPEKQKFGSNDNVLLKDDEFNKLIRDFGQERTMAAIDYLSEYFAERPDYERKSKSHYATIRRWVMDAVDEREQKKNRSAGYGSRAPQTEEQFYGGILDFLKGDQENGSETIQ